MLLSLIEVTVAKGSISVRPCRMCVGLCSARAGECGSFHRPRCHAHLRARKFLLKMCSLESSVPLGVAAFHSLEGRLIASHESTRTEDSGTPTMSEPSAHRSPTPITVLASTSTFSNFRLGPASPSRSCWSASSDSSSDSTILNTLTSLHWRPDRATSCDILDINRNLLGCVETLTGTAARQQLLIPLGAWLGRETSPHRRSTKDQI